MNQQMSRRPRPRPGMAIALVTSCVGLSGLGCLTPGQTRSVGEQLGEIRRQAEQVRSEQWRNGESIDAITPVAQHSTGGSIEGRPEPRSTMAQQPERPMVVTASDRASGPDEMVQSSAPHDERLFRAGYALYHRRDYQAAERQLRLFLAGDPTGPMADDALFWIGECRFARGLYRDAIFEYRAVIDRQADGNLVPRAWYMIALSHERLGEPTAMKDHLAIVVEEYPHSDVAVLARDRLGRLGQAPSRSLQTSFP